MIAEPAGTFTTASAVAVAAAMRRLFQPAPYTAVTLVTGPVAARLRLTWPGPPTLWMVVTRSPPPVPAPGILIAWPATALANPFEALVQSSGVPPAIVASVTNVACAPAAGLVTTVTPALTLEVSSGSPPGPPRLPSVPVQAGCCFEGGAPPIEATSPSARPGRLERRIWFGWLTAGGSRADRARHRTGSSRRGSSRRSGRTG